MAYPANRKDWTFSDYRTWLKERTELVRELALTAHEAAGPGAILFEFRGDDVRMTYLAGERLSEFTQGLTQLGAEGTAKDLRTVIDLYNPATQSAFIILDHDRIHGCGVFEFEKKDG